MLRRRTTRATGSGSAAATKPGWGRHLFLLQGRSQGAPLCPGQPVPVEGIPGAALGEGSLGLAPLREELERGEGRRRGPLQLFTGRPYSLIRESLPALSPLWMASGLGSSILEGLLLDRCLSTCHQQSCSRSPGLPCCHPASPLPCWSLDRLCGPLSVPACH